MFLRKRVLVCTSLLCLLCAGTSHAAHPLISDDAWSLGKGAVQIELNGDIGSNRETRGNETVNSSPSQIATTIGVGITDTIDLTFGITRPWSSGDINGLSFNDAGSLDYSLVLKWQLFGRDGLNIALKPQLGYSSTVGTVDDDHTISYGATLIFSKEFEPFAAHLNVGYTYNDYHLTAVRESNRGSIWNVSLATSCDIAKKLKLVADVGASTNQNKAVSEMPVFALAGLIYSVSKNVDLSGGVKVGLTKPETDLSGTFGVTLKF